MNEYSTGGFGGCNNWGGTVEIDEDRFHARNLEATARACEDPVTMEMEQVFLNSLRGATRWRMDGQAVMLEGTTGHLVLLPHR